MQYGSPVLYVDSNGDEHDSMATAVVGTGPSGFKRINLVFGDKTRDDVPHELDAAKGGVHWKERPVGEPDLPAGGAFAVIAELTAEQRAEEPPAPAKKK